MSEPVPPTHFRACCRNVIGVLQKTGVMTPELDARLLISNALGLEGAAFFLHPDRVLSEEELSEIATALARRMAGEPVSRIIGRRAFWKHEFLLDPAVLDPRPDSETLVETALDLFGGADLSPLRKDREMTLLDLGTGSGALLISLLLEWPQARGVGVDVSPEALRVARQNAKALNCLDRVEFVEGNWIFEGLEKGRKFDLVICNPPYIESEQIEGLAREVAQYDPPLALDGGADGLAAYRAIVPRLDQVMKDHGVVIFEIGQGQEQAVAALLEKAGYRPIGKARGQYRDLAGIIRCLAFTLDKGTCNGGETGLHPAKR